MADIEGYLDIIRTASSGESVRDAIIQCMNDINQDSALELTKLVITGKLSQVNHSWKPGTGKAYSMVSLQVSPDDGSDVPTTNTLTYEEFNVNNDTTAGRHAAPEGTVYNAVNVNIDFSQYEEGIADNITISVDDLEADHTYSAVSQGYNAMKKITLTGAAIDKAIEEKGGSIGPDGATYYPCTFYSDTGKQSVMQTVSVREGDDAAAYITKDPTPPTGKVLNGWSPDTRNVKSKKEFIPKWADQSGTQVGEIADSWDVIFESGSATYGVGSWKNVDFVGGTVGPRTFSSAVNIPGAPASEQPKYEFPKLTLISKSVPFMQVAQGERGTVSTWVSMEPFYILARDVNNNSYYNPVPYGYQNGNYGFDYWETSYFKRVLNEIIFTRLDSRVSAHVVDVTKATKGAKSNTVTSATINADDNSLSTRTANAKLWIPSYGEIHGFYTTENRNFNGTYKDPNLWIDEPGSIDYYSRCPEFAAIIDQHAFALPETGFMALRTQTAVLPRNSSWRIALTTAIIRHEVENEHYYGGGPDDIQLFQAGSSVVYIGFCLNA
ncbi:MAG: hypothetical protein J6U54_11175 [Clostridiales bacterium]|nr:hypothetical protein [Clostridiales bacterium]